MDTQDFDLKFTGSTGKKLEEKSKLVYNDLKKFYESSTKKSFLDAKILDFGCGTGRILKLFLENHPTLNLFGVDPDKDVIQVAKSNCPGAHIVTSERIPEKFPLREQFDFIYSYSVFTHISEKIHLKCLETFSKILKPEGLCLITIRPRKNLIRKYRDNEQLKNFVERFDKNEFVFIPTQEGPLSIDFGFCCYSNKYIMKNWSEYFKIIDFSVNPKIPFQKYVLLAQKTSQIKPAF